MRGMADRRPPRSVAEERETLVSLLQFQRESLVRKVAGVGPAEAVASPVASGTSLLWLVKHLTWAELAWFRWRVMGEDIELPDDEVAEGDTIESAIADYQAAWERVAPVLAEGDLDAVMLRDDGQPPCNLRFVIGHMVEETARHAGHADILREMLDGATGR
jgi:hypothetical protein